MTLNPAPKEQINLSDSPELCQLCAKEILPRHKHRFDPSDQTCWIIVNDPHDAPLYPSNALESDIPQPKPGTYITKYESHLGAFLIAQIRSAFAQRRDRTIQLNMLPGSVEVSIRVTGFANGRK